MQSESSDLHEMWLYTPLLLHQPVEQSAIQSFCDNRSIAQSAGCTTNTANECLIMLIDVPSHVTISS